MTAYEEDPEFDEYEDLEDETTKEHLEVKLKELNEYFKKMGKKTIFHFDKDMNGYKLVNSGYYEFTQKRNGKTEMYDKLYAINEVLRYIVDRD